jgi:AraC-like DNA-binding protein
VKPSPPRTRIIHSQWGASRFEAATRAPAAHLRPFLQGYVGYVETAPGPVIRRELPNTAVVLIVEFGAPIRISAPGSLTPGESFPGGFVAGLTDAFTLTRHDGTQRGLQVNLTPLGARALFGLPLSELAHRSLSLRDLLPREHRSLAERLASLPDWDSRFDLIERLLTARAADLRPATDPAAWAARRIASTRGAVDLRTLARELGYSSKHVITLFRDGVGLTPMRYARLVRFEAMIAHLKSASSLSWSELALRCGYYDQAHLARDVRAFTGVTPTQTRAALVDLLSPPQVNSVQSFDTVPP